MQLQFSILSWGAWSPEYQDAAAWQHWQPSPAESEVDRQTAPQLPTIAAMQRRRFSRLTKMMLDVCAQCHVDNQTRSIFASRHGELNRTIGLLEDIINQQPLSPLAFSQSVHNTASGIYGILNDNRSASTSIAAGTETLSQAMIEAYAQLCEDPTPLMLVFGDDPVPPVYSQFTQEFELPLALGLQLAPKDQRDSPQLIIESLDDKRATECEQISYGALINALATSSTIEGVLACWRWTLRYAR